MSYENIEYLYIHESSQKNDRSLTFLIACDRGYERTQGFKYVEELKFAFLVKFQKNQIKRCKDYSLQKHFNKDLINLYRKWKNTQVRHKQADIEKIEEGLDKLKFNLRNNLSLVIKREEKTSILIEIYGNFK